MSTVKVQWLLSIKQLMQMKEERLLPTFYWSRWSRFVANFFYVISNFGFGMTSTTLPFFYLKLGVNCKPWLMKKISWIIKKKVQKANFLYMSKCPLVTILETSVPGQGYNFINERNCDHCWCRLWSTSSILQSK